MGIAENKDDKNKRKNIPMPSIEPKTIRKIANIGYTKQKDFRLARYIMIKKYVGRWYGYTPGEEQCVSPLNLIYQAVTTIVPLVVFKNPKAFCTSNYNRYDDYAETLEMAINHIIVQLDLAEMLRMVVTDSMFMGGFVRRGLGLCGKGLEMEGEWYDLGQPCIDYVSSDDIIPDPNARTWADQKIIGNHYEAEYDTMLEIGVPKEDLDKMTSSSVVEKTAANINRANTMHGDSQELAKILRFTDVYNRDNNTFYTFARDGSGEITGNPLMEKEYEGPDDLPYDMLGYAYAPDNLMPIPPVSLWIDPNRLVNELTVKMANQATRNKSILAYEPDAWQDAENIANAEDGLTVRVGDIEAIKELKLGGVSEDVYRYVAWAKQNFNEQAMNMQLLGGIQANQETATQSTMMMQQSTLRVNDMVNRTYAFTARQVKYLAWHLHHAPYIEPLPLAKKRNNKQQTKWFTAETRQGRWLDYVMGVHPMSMERRDPTVQSKRILDFFATVTPALAQAQQMLGPAFKMNEALKILGRYMGIDELEDLVSIPELDQVNELRLQAISKNTEGPGKADDYGGRVGQPNPMAMGAINSLGAEQNQMQQEVAGMAQQEMLR